MRTIFSTIIIAFMTIGCSATHPAIQEYTILPSYTPNEKTEPINATLKLSSTRAISSLSSTQLYYLKEISSIDSYLYSRWSDSPASMIDRALNSSLQNRHLFIALIPSTSSASADLILESDLNAFYHRFVNDNKSEGFIDATYRLVDSKTKKTIASKRFVITEPSASADAKGGVNALTKATHHLSSASVEWLEHITRKNQ
jgi:cholesterol transport system auxiliary component